MEIGPTNAALRPERPQRNLALDGLRGIAVLLVTIAHASFPLLKFGGIVGVTLFFVLSGYLITTLLLDEQRRSSSIAFGAFYARRALRLLPALITVLIGGSVIWILIGHNHKIGTTARGAVAVLFYVGNLTPMIRNLDIAPFGHFWSLAMEEQYYLVWPLLLAVGIGLRIRGRYLFGATMALAVVSLVLRFSGPIGTVDGYNRVYVLPWTNVWALLFGSALALFPLERARVSVPAWVTRVEYVLLFAVASVLGLHDGLHEQANASTYFVRLLAGPIAGVLAILVVHDAVRNPTNRRWLTHRGLVFFGSISYGLYLWHAVVDGVVSTLYGATGVRGFAYGMVGAVFAVGLAILSRRWVERPFLRRKHKFERTRHDNAAGDVANCGRGCIAVGEPRNRCCRQIKLGRRCADGRRGTGSAGNGPSIFGVGNVHAVAGSCVRVIFVERGAGRHAEAEPTNWGRQYGGGAMYLEGSDFDGPVRCVGR